MKICVNCRRISRFGAHLLLFFFFLVCVYIDETRVFQRSSFCHWGWRLIASDKKKCLSMQVCSSKHCCYVSLIGGDWVDKRPVDITACGRYDQYQKLRDSHSQSQLEGRRPLHGHLEPGRTVSITHQHSTGRYIGIVFGYIWKRDSCKYPYSPAYSGVWLAGCMRRKLKRLTARMARQPSLSLATVTQRFCHFTCSKKWRRAGAGKRRTESPNPSK